MKKRIYLLCMCICVFLLTRISETSRENIKYSPEQLEARVLVYANESFRGSGTYINNYVLTNYHVVEKYDPHKNFLVFARHDTIPFVIVSKDSITDLALLKPLRKPLARALGFKEILKRNADPEINDSFVGIGYPKGQLRSIKSSFLQTKKVDIFRTLYEMENKKQTTLDQAHVLLKQDTLDYRGASGTLMLSQRSCGILTGVNENIFALVNNRKLISFLKKSGYY